VHCSRSGSATQSHELEQCTRAHLAAPSRTITLGLRKNHQSWAR